MSAKIDLTNWKVQTIVPKVSKENAHLLSKNFILGQAVSFHLINVNVSIANSIRRTILGDLTVKHLTFEPAAFNTTDEYIIDQLIFNRIRMIPVLQTVNAAEEFILHIKNTTADMLDVYSSDIVSKTSKTVPFNGTFKICNLNKGKELKIAFTIATTPVRENGAITPATNVVSLPLDQEPINILDPNSTGISSLVSNPKNYKIAFKSLGVMDAKLIVSTSCKILIKRLKKYRDIAASISNGTKQHVEVLRENCTIAEVLCKEVFDMNGKVAMYNETDKNVTTMTIHSENGNINTVLSAAIEKLIEKYERIDELLK